ncbi:hypothetical protein SETIT_3G071600v2, partial [Setaria italica]
QFQLEGARAVHVQQPTRRRHDDDGDGDARLPCPPHRRSSRRCYSGDRPALGGPADHFASWTPDTPCCDWFGVETPNVTGAIPDAIAGLTHLQGLILQNLPALSGPIPRAIAKLSGLSQLIVAYTAVSGPVPSFLGALTNLVALDLSFNSLTGAIPASLAALPNLSGINLSGNRLTGAIPPLLLSKAAGKVYDNLLLSDNHLSGTIPADFAAVNFQLIDLSGNALTGNASGLVGGANDVQWLDLSRNALSFNFSSVELPEHLYFMTISHNDIYGGIPAEVAKLTSLNFFNVSYNRLCGPVPTGGNMAWFDVYNYQHNECLCGPPLPTPCT